MQILRNKKFAFFLLILIFGIYSSFLIFQVAAKFNSDTSLSLLASQFLTFHISLAPNDDLPLGDIAKFQGKYYVYFGPFPSILLMPFVAIFGKSFPQVFIGILSLIVSFWAVFSITRSQKFQVQDALWLSLFFVFSTVLLSASLINISAYQVQALSVPLILLSLRQYIVKRSFFWAGLLLGLAVLTRSMLILGALFYIAEYLQKKFTVKQLIFFFIPLGISCLILGAYNYVRFLSLFETGYIYSTALNSFPLSLNMQYGYMSLIHIPANLYAFLIKPPEPVLIDPKGFVLQFPYLKASAWGMAIWFTSPLFIKLLTKFKKGKYTLSAAIAAFAIAIPVFTFFSIGFAQFGFRYTLDFLPFLFLLLLPGLAPKLSRFDLVLITAGVIFNCLYITSLWGKYPHFGIY